ncbi:hypothetical protein PVAP13_4NG052560 [Panicum virgatum]|uniref:Uncharacterized protein n=1 Tax=Panicum virgatum TaxID=38727 RepID=A0A8T0SZ91_PANVG|nr:hypothetical protein PVAP13_4NG052560 [Panicum virgatum]
MSHLSIKRPGLQFLPNRPPLRTPTSPPAQASAPPRRRCPESGAPPLHRAAVPAPFPDRQPPRSHRFNEHDGPVRGVHFHATQLLFVPGGNPLDLSSSRPPCARFIMGACIIAVLRACFCSSRIRSRSMTSAVVKKI